MFKTLRKEVLQFRCLELKNKGVLRPIILQNRYWIIIKGLVLKDTLPVLLWGSVKRKQIVLKAAKL